MSFPLTTEVHGHQWTWLKLFLVGVGYLALLQFRSVLLSKLALGDDVSSSN